MNRQPPDPRGPHPHDPPPAAPAGGSDVGGSIGIALLGAVVGFAVTALFLYAPWDKLSSRDRGAGTKIVQASDAGDASVADASAKIAAVAGVDGGLAVAATAVPRTYNVLMITVDTLRHDLGYAGYPKPITPNIDALALRSTIFDRAYSTASFTPKSLGPMMIGRYSSETLSYREHYTTFHAPNVFLAERAHAAGVKTFAAMCHRYFTFKSGFTQGFDTFDTSAMPPGMTDSDTRFTSEQLTNVALQMLAKPANVTGPSRFFAWFHYFDPHAPYVSHKGAPDLSAKDRSAGARARAIYDEEVWFTDLHIGRLLDYVKAQPWAADTAIILTADHGEAFGEHGHWKHGRELWEPLVRVPLVVHVPGTKPRHIATNRSHVDLAPTVVHLLGAPGDRALRGKTVLPDVFSNPGAALEERDIYIDMPEGPFNEMRRAIIMSPSPGTKLIERDGRHFELYDLAADPNETANLASDQARLRSGLERLGKLREGLEELAPTAR